MQKGVEYIDERGVSTLTNQHDLYGNLPGYTAVEIEYDPIVVPGRLKKTNATSYSSADIEHLVQRYARRYGLAPSLILAVIRAESNFDPYAVSPKGARGLMQLMPGTAAAMHVGDPFDPAQNIAGGTQYLARMLRLFHNNLDLALAAYNAGPETVKKYKGVPPFPETRQYIRNVQAFRARFEREGVTPKLLAGAKRPGSSYVPGAEGARYIIRFHSGLTQPADQVVEKSPYYYVVFQDRTYSVRMNLVKEIVKSG